MRAALCAALALALFTAPAAARDRGFVWPWEFQAPAAKPHHHHRAHVKHAKRVKTARRHPVGHGAALDGGSLVARAARYIGTNPTGWARVWCGRFMAMIAPRAAAHVRNPNLARAWAALPRVGPRVGAIVVLSRRGGPQAGHVGVVKGFTRHGDPIVISGNHNRVVGVGVYPRSRVVAYVAAL
ncbi:MAG TPA: CHAP domain-containing protein [Xanthobacteraceae bacterium]|nr:CHAP domain-containing protein [Xanthobacteraceae bacterium]